MNTTAKYPNPSTIASYDPVICSCHCVPASVIQRAINRGFATSVDEVTLQTAAGSGCGSCKCRIQRLLSGLPAECGPCALCPGCGYIQKLCLCKAAWVFSRSLRRFCEESIFFIGFKGCLFLSEVVLSWTFIDLPIEFSLQTLLLCKEMNKL